MEGEIAADVIRRLERLGVDYCITGSEALPRYGEPRQTADLILDRDDAWAQSAMARHEVWDHPRLGRVWVLSMEDLILAKLEWSGGVSELQLRDCANLLRTNPGVDWSYLERYADVLGVEGILARLRAASA